MEKIKVKFYLLGLIISINILTGCWDYQEIENRGFVTGIAIDNPKAVKDKINKSDDTKSERDLINTPLRSPGGPKYAFTAQLPVIARSQAKPSGSSGGVTDKKRYWDVTAVGNSIFELNRELSTRVEYAPFYEHMQVLILSEDVARDSVSRPLDMLLRDAEMRRRMKVFITPQEAYKILDVTPEIDDYSSFYLRKLPNNSSKTSRILYYVDIGEISEKTHGNKDYLLPRIISSKTEIKDAGSAVIKNDKMVGWLGEIDTANAEWIKGMVKGGTYTTKIPGETNDLLTLEIKKVKTKVKPTIKDNDIRIVVDVKATFDIAEITSDDYKNTFFEEFNDTIESQVEDELQESLQDTIKYVQEKFGADIFNFDTAMQRYAPNTWDEVKNRWREIFPSIKTEVIVDASIKKRGLIK